MPTLNVLELGRTVWTVDICTNNIKMENQQKALLLLEIAREDKKEKKEETNKQTKTKNTNIY